MTGERGITLQSHLASHRLIVACCKFDASLHPSPLLQVDQPSFLNRVADVGRKVSVCSAAICCLILGVTDSTLTQVCLKLWAPLHVEELAQPGT